MRSARRGCRPSYPPSSLNPLQAFVGEFDSLDGDFIAGAFERGAGPFDREGAVEGPIALTVALGVEHDYGQGLAVRLAAKRLLERVPQLVRHGEAVLERDVSVLGAAGELEYGRVLAALQPLEDFAFCLDAGGLGEACNEVGFDLDPELVDGENVIKQRFPTPAATSASTRATGGCWA